MSLRIPLMKTMTPQRLRQLLERLGPTFIKIGQFLALRPDLVPQAYCDELMGLLDLVPPFPWRAAKQTIEQELGHSPLELFAFINERAFAAGSLAQVHLARLQDGTTVAVKILRPNIEADIARDLKRARRIAALLEASRASYIASPREVVAELEQWLSEEIDLRNELDNMSRLYQRTSPNLPQRIPRPFPEYSSRRVLTAEFIRGVPLSEILRALRSGRAESVLKGFDAKLYAERLVIATFTQMFRYGFFHADLHPGNLLVLSGSVVGFVDFGLCDELEPAIQASQLRYLAAIYSGETERIFRTLTEILTPAEDSDLEGFRRDFLAESRKLESGGSTRTEASNGQTSSSVERSPLAAYLVGLIQSARRNHLLVPARVLSMYRTLLTVETIAAELGTRDSLRKIGKEFFGSLQREQMVNELSDVAHLESMIFTLLNLKRDAPGQVSQILARLAEGSLMIQMQTLEAQNVARMRNRRTWLVVLAVIAVSISMLLTVPALPHIFGVSLAWPLGITLVGLYLEILRQWRRLQKS